jgi:hypothetical protein
LPPIPGAGASTNDGGENCRTGLSRGEVGWLNDDGGQPRKWRPWGQASGHRARAPDPSPLRPISSASWPAPQPPPFPAMKNPRLHHLAWLTQANRRIFASWQAKILGNAKYPAADFACLRGRKTLS